MGNTKTITNSVHKNRNTVKGKNISKGGKKNSGGLKRILHEVLVIKDTERLVK
jgi:hypothetical protein